MKYFYAVFGALVLTTAVVSQPAVGVAKNDGRGGLVKGEGDERVQTPIELELNRALKKTFGQGARAPKAKPFRRSMTTRISITHKLSAPLNSTDIKERERAFRKLRQSLYVQVAEECAILSEAFGKACHMSSINIRPASPSRLSVQDVQLTATVTYVLDEFR